jgi:hypothetical protein
MAQPTGSSGVQSKNWLMPGVCTITARRAAEPRPAAITVGFRPPMARV